MAGEAEPIARRRPEAEFDEALAKIRVALHRAVAGLEVDVIAAVGNDALARGPDAAAPTRGAGRREDTDLLQVGRPIGEHPPMPPLIVANQRAKAHDNCAVDEQQASAIEL